MISLAVSIVPPTTSVIPPRAPEVISVMEPMVSVTVEKSPLNKGLNIKYVTTTIAKAAAVRTMISRMRSLPAELWAFEVLLNTLSILAVIGEGDATVPGCFGAIADIFC